MPPVKIVWNDEIRRFTLPSLTYESLRSTIKTILNFSTDDDDAFSLKFIDSDADEVTIGSDMELEIARQDAIQQSRILKLIVTRRNGRETDGGGEDDEEDDDLGAVVVEQFEGKRPKGGRRRGCRGSGKSKSRLKTY